MPTYIIDNNYIGKIISKTIKEQLKCLYCFTFYKLHPNFSKKRTKKHLVAYLSPFMLYFFFELVSWTIVQISVKSAEYFFLFASGSQDCSASDILFCSLLFYSWFYKKKYNLSHFTSSYLFNCIVPILGLEWFSCSFSQQPSN